jgi:hypothetical protein
MIRLLLLISCLCDGGLLLFLQKFVENLGDLHIEDKHDANILESYNIVNLAFIDKYGQVHINLLKQGEFLILILRGIDFNLKISLDKLLVRPHRYLNNS